MTIEKLNEIIESKKVKTIEELLPLLPEGLRKNYTLMYESRSEQSASYLDPRVILFGEDGRFVITFNGTSNQLEIMEFNDKKNRFELHEIIFSSKTGSDQPKPKHERNPERCTKCHSSDPKPIWASYDLWPGAYGEHDDNLRALDPISREQHEDLKRSPYYRQDNQDLDLFKAYQDHLAHSQNHPRYRYLVRQGKAEPYYTYRYIDEEDESHTYNSRDTDYMPNTRLSGLFGALNIRRVFRQMHEAESYERFQSLVALSLLDCELKPELTQMIEKQFNTHLSGLKPYELRKVITQILHKEGLPFNEQIGLNLLGQESGYGYNDGFNGMESKLLKLIFQNMFEAHPKLKEFYHETPQRGAVDRGTIKKSFTDVVNSLAIGIDKKKAAGSCDLLNQIAKERLKNLPISNSAECTVDASQPEESLKNLAKDINSIGSKIVPVSLNKCASCHNESSKIKPSVLFSNPESLLNYINLAKDNSSKFLNALKRMPPKSPLSKSEREEVLQYISTK